MKNAHIIFLIIISTLAPPLYGSESPEHEHDHAPSQTNSANHSEEEGVSRISEAMAAKLGVVTSQISSQTLQQTLTSFGRLTSAPENTSHIRARFPGVIRTVAVNIGDTVNTGDLMAVVESNESLKRYELRAPIAGTVIQRHANAGEMSQDQVLFSILSTDSLWAELRIFPSQQQSIHLGNAVRLSTASQRYDGVISHLLPADSGAPYLIARVKIKNSDGAWFPWMLVEAAVLVNEFNVALAVRNPALQEIDGQTGIFIKNQNKYRFTPLVLGRSDAEFTEVLAGAEENSAYVSGNSYLIKADIEKSESSHEH